ncbi:metalloprotease [Podospora australis]|uniref:Metalloprotease n=1 Tax=Podospora australis TaxID=1536484 RepID=A0AAN6WJR0_9PEZI|nr:metalloprotease [Podospora australis]
MSARCCIVPPYLLQGIAESAELPDEAKVAAQRTLSTRDTFTVARAERFDVLSQPRAARAAASAHHHPQPSASERQSIVPEILLQHIADAEDVDDETKERARRDIDRIRAATSQYQKQLTGEDEEEAKAPTSAFAIAGADTEDKKKKKQPTTGFYRAVHDAKNDDDEDNLPGQIIRVEGQLASVTEDAAVNEAYDNVGKVLEFYLKQFGWKSIDNRNAHVISTVHFGKNYENAFWDPSRNQMVFGDGHTFLYRFVNCIDVIGHELTHAITEHTSPLVYRDQPGALNEHVSDVFGIMVKQMVENETAAEADWLIGEGCLLPDVKGVALRSMKDPGTAYNDPRFGKDPQPAHMDGYKKTTRDNGGVHLYSGIPNKAFYLASIAFGGYSWEKAGQIWWKAMTSGSVPPRCSFVQFSDVTTEVAEELYGEEAAKIVRAAWNEVGVVRKH